MWHWLRQGKTGLAKILSEHTAGILGTLAIHLFIAILFLSLQIKSQSENMRQKQIMVEFKREKMDVLQKMEKKKQEQQEQIKKQAQQELARDKRRNIAVNKGQMKDKYNTKKYLDELKKKYEIESPKRRETPEIDKNDNGEVSVPEKGEAQETKEAASKEKEEYKGPTTIWYDVANREDKHMKTPVYLCTNSGKVVVNVKVDRKGQVQQASVNKEASEVNDPCLHEAAVEAAEQSRFNTDFDADYRQKGTITYLFRKQENL